MFQEKMTSFGKKEDRRAMLFLGQPFMLSLPSPIQSIYKMIDYFTLTRVSCSSWFVFCVGDIFLS